MGFGREPQRPRVRGFQYDSQATDTTSDWGHLDGMQPVTLAYACLVLIWASLVAEICNQRRAVPPLPRRVSFAFSLIAGITVGILLSVLGI
jgi:hypothetical protein